MFNKVLTYLLTYLHICIGIATGSTDVAIWKRQGSTNNGHPVYSLLGSISIVNKLQMTYFVT